MRDQEQRRRNSKHRWYASDPTAQCFCEKFYGKHGGEDAREFVVIGSTVTFVDGATLERSQHGIGNVQEPSDDALERAQTIERYWKFKAKELEDAFFRYQGALEGNGTGIVEECDEEEKLAKLLKLRKAARQAKKKLREAKREVEMETPATITAKRRNHADFQERQRQFVKKIREVKI